jgi:hypothetical protein
MFQYEKKQMVHMRLDAGLLKRLEDFRFEHQRSIRNWHRRKRKSRSPNKEARRFVGNRATVISRLELKPS